MTERENSAYPGQIGYLLDVKGIIDERVYGPSGVISITSFPCYAASSTSRYAPSERLPALA